MLQKKNLTTSTTRFASIISLIDFTKNFHNIYIYKKKCIKKNRKVFNKTNYVNCSNSFGLHTAGVGQVFLYNKKPYNCFLQITTIYNSKIIVPGTEYLMPGKKIFDLTRDLLIKKIFYLGSHIFLKDLPYNLFVNCVSNNLNNKWTFSKSSGTFMVKLKAKKTVKLILMQLPSMQTYLFFKNTRSFIGKNTNFFNNKFVEGKWGFSLHKTKLITVRGVAMNPVDHPNGGRTKAKQPEKSPWGWIAKRGK